VHPHCTSQFHDSTCMRSIVVIVAAAAAAVAAAAAAAAVATALPHPPPQDGNGVLDREEVRNLLQTDVRCTAGICLVAQVRASEG
jgi:hypothetical protein